MKKIPSIYWVAAAVGVGIWYIHKEATATATAVTPQVTSGQFAGQTMTERRMRQFASMRSASAAEHPLYRQV
jgi:type IV secretory pathway TrbD component